MELNKQVVHMFLREVHVRDFDGTSAEPTSMHRLDYQQSEQDPNLFEFKLTFMFGHFGTQVDGVLEAAILIQSEDGADVDILAEIKKEEALFAIPLFAKASSIITKLSEDRGQFPIIVPIELWLEQ
ncbi:hypothetical protein ROU88_07725 [Macrococcus capreoli]|uniref:hypothetical protein n=1 Tax=Macrococcus capreoli TaxID=2982690 RepID=UPI0021D56EAE|nr:hypothetical protein [Macrococcus sp. TMW 2.2395]MCU7556184.1 hypothetical protein [Macrococcus sp. TMW 2.2395]